MIGTDSSLGDVKLWRAMHGPGEEWRHQAFCRSGKQNPRRQERNKEGKWDGTKHNLSYIPVLSRALARASPPSVWKAIPWAASAQLQPLLSDTSWLLVCRAAMEAAALLAWGLLTWCSCFTNLLIIFILFHLAELRHVFYKMHNQSVLLLFNS